MLRTKKTQKRAIKDVVPEPDYGDEPPPGCSFSELGEIVLDPNILGNPEQGNVAEPASSSGLLELKDGAVSDTKQKGDKAHACGSRNTDTELVLVPA